MHGSSWLNIYPQSRRAAILRLLEIVTARLANLQIVNKEIKKMYPKRLSLSPSNSSKKKKKKKKTRPPECNAISSNHKACPILK
jgi:hypothetical protein